jgi:hypothetical protein
MATPAVSDAGPQSPTQPKEPGQPPFISMRSALIAMIAVFCGAVIGGLTFLAGGSVPQATIAGLTVFAGVVAGLDKLVGR